MTRRLGSLALTLALAHSAAAQVPADKALATMQVADGFQVELFAHEPLLLNPTSMDVDHKGRVWVAEAVNYRRVNFNRPILRPEGDRIVVLKDTNGDGRADESVVFYQGKDLYGPLGVCVAPTPANPDRKGGGGQRVFVCQSPDILVFEDADGDLKADGPPKKFLTGFGGFDHDHGVHGINIGPDGKFYFTVGDAGVKNLRASDGKGPAFTSNTTDVRAGTVWRCDTDGTDLELIAHNFRNNYEACVNSFGEVWLSDNDDDGNQQTRICFVMPGGNYGYHPRGAGQTHWHEEQPGVVHKTLRTGFGSPTGITFYEGTLFPQKYRGQLLHTDAGPREVRCFHIKPKGAGHELDKEVLLTSTDNWFRPSDVTVAPDGSVFVCDWYDPGVGGHGMGDWTRGRVFRLTPKGHTGYKVPEVKLDIAEGVLAALGSPNLATRAAARAALAALPPLEAGKARALALASPDPTAQARAMQLGPIKLGDAAAKDVLAALPGVTARLAANSFRVQEDPLFAALAVRHDVGVRKPGEPPAGLVFRSEEEVVSKRRRPAVLRELLLALPHVRDLTPAKREFYRLAKLYDGQDIFYRAALNIACGTDPKRRDAILADFDKHFPEWDDKVADLVWELRPKSVLPRLEKLLADAKLAGPQKARIVDILAASDDPTAGQTMLAVLKSDVPAEVKARALDQLRLFLPTKWKGLQGGKDLAAAVDALLADPKTKLTALQLIDAADAVDRVDTVATAARDEAAPADVRAQAVRTLGGLRSPKSVDALAAIATGPTRDPVPPLKVEAVNALAALVTRQAKDNLSPKALAVLQRMVTDKGTGGAMQKAAVEALAGTRAGTGWLLELHAKKELPEPLVADTGRLLRNSPFQGERNRALLQFPAPGKLDPKKLPPLGELARRPGNAERGKQVWNASLEGAAQCAKCHMVRGVGGQVGPDLSMIGKKGSLENLFESILVPSKAIADQYLQHSVSTVAGVTVSGLLMGDNGNAITLRDANGKDTVIPKGDIEGQRQLKVSIMPEDIVAALTEDELVDLVAYLQTLQTAALTPDSFRVVGPFPTAGGNDVKTEHGPEKTPFDAALKFRAKDKMLAWQAIRPDAKGYFDLAAAHGAAGNNSVSYMYAEVESPADQDAEVLLGTDDGAKLWVNGKEVFAGEQTRTAAPGQSAVPVKLKKGANAVLLKVANGNNPHGFYFTLLEHQELKAVPTK